MAEREAYIKERIQQLRAKITHVPAQDADPLRQGLRRIGVYGINPASDAFYDHVLGVVAGKEINGYFLFMQLPTSAHMLKDGGFYEQGLVKNQYNDGKGFFAEHVMPGLKEHIEQIIDVLAPSKEVAKDAKETRAILHETLGSKGELDESVF